MNPKMRRKLSGAFLTREISPGSWRLTRRESPVVDVYLREAATGADEAFRGAAVSDVAIEWRRDAAVLNLISDSRPRTLEVRSAFVHQPLPELYEALPLASFDGRARRFWRRVFFLVRMPGGRGLLRILAGRSRGTR